MTTSQGVAADATAETSAAFVAQVGHGGRRATPGRSFVPAIVIPPIMLALGLRQVYGADSPIGVNLVDSPLLLVGGYVVLSLPFTYRAIDNAMRAVDVVLLTEASESLGAGAFGTFRSVILPG